MKVALVYDRVNSWGGAERVLLALHKIWPEAPLFTAVYDPQGASWAKVFKVIPSFINRFPFAPKSHEIYPWLTPLAFECFDFSDFEVVVSVTSADAKGIITKPKTLHVCYCLTPTRYLWSGYENYFRNTIFKILTKPVVRHLRNWDVPASQRPDEFISISQNVARRVKKYYHRDSVVIYPPVDVLKWKPTKTNQEDYFLLVSRLVYYKRADIAIEAFNQLGLPLKIVGTGSDCQRLKKMAKNNISFLGQLTDKELLGYYQGCQAVVFPQEEDFGLVPLEAQACGRPVIALKAGGVLETVVEGKTGVFFYPQTAAALKEAVLNFGTRRFAAEDCQENARRFREEIFIKDFQDFVSQLWKEKS